MVQTGVAPEACGNDVRFTFPVGEQPQESYSISLAAKIGVMQSIVSAAERDERKLSAEMAVRFALALDVTMDDLLGPATGP